MFEQIVNILIRAAEMYAIGLFSFIAVVVFGLTVFAHFIVGQLVFNLVKEAFGGDDDD